MPSIESLTVRRTARLALAAWVTFACAEGPLGCGTSPPSPDNGFDSTDGGSSSSGGVGAGSSGGSGAGGTNSSSSGSGASSSSGSSSSSSSSGSGSSSGGPVTPDGGYGASGDGGSCASTLTSRVRITEVDLGVAYQYNEVDSNGAGLGLTPLAISPIPSGGSRLGFLGTDGKVHVATLDANDQLVASSVISLAGYDFQDVYADDKGGVALISRTALGSTSSNNCGNIDNLCGLTSNYPTAASCYDMYLVRFDGSSETWATKLTDTTASLPAYGTSATSGGNVIFIWSEYAHNGRIVFDGTNYGAYFGAAITVPNQSCVGSSTLTTGVNIHQGDRMKVVSASGAIQSSGFDWGCSHSGYERLAWDPTAKRYVAVCKNDLPDGTSSGRVALAPNFSSNAVSPVDLSYSDLGSVLVAGGGGYWVASSNIRAGQTANTDGLADVDLWHFNLSGSNVATPNAPDKSIKLVSDSENDRAPHLVAYGASSMIAAWEESTATGALKQGDANRKMYIQVVDSATGAAAAGASSGAGPLQVAVTGSRYQDFRPYPDGSVAYPAPGSSSTKVKILRVLSCN